MPEQIPNSPYTVETDEDLMALKARGRVFLMDHPDGPTLVSPGGEGWVAVRALNDGDWASGKRHPAQWVALDWVLPLTVLWHDGMRP